MKRVTITFIYDDNKNEDEQVFIDKAFDEIYNSDDVLDNDAFLVEDVKI